MSYDSIGILANLKKVDGNTLEDISQFFPYILNKFVLQSLRFGNDLSIEEPVSSVLLIDTTYTGYPQIYDLDNAAFQLLLNSNTRNNFINSPKRLHEGNPASNNFFNVGCVIDSINASKDQLDACNAYFRGRSLDTSNAGRGMQPYFTDNDKMFIGWGSEGAYDREFMNNTNANPLPMLLYYDSLVDDLQTQYGYREVCPHQPYSALNWLVVNGHYFRIMYLTRFDAWVHAGGAYNNNLLTKDIATSQKFALMIKCISYFNENATETSNWRSGIQWNVRRSSCSLQKGEYLISGQFIYSRNFQYKLHMRKTGICGIYMLPIKSLVPIYEPFPKDKNLPRVKDSYVPCIFYAQPDGNIVTYMNCGFSATAVIRGDPIAASGTGVDKRMSSKPYFVMVMPSGHTTIMFGNSGSLDDGHARFYKTLDYDYVNADMNNKRAVETSDCINRHDIYDQNLNLLYQNITNDPQNKAICYSSKTLIKAGDNSYWDGQVQQTLWAKGESTLGKYNNFDAGLINLQLLTTGPVSIAIKNGWISVTNETDINNAMFAGATSRVCSRGISWANNFQLCLPAIKFINQFKDSSFKTFVDNDIKRACTSEYAPKSIACAGYSAIDPALNSLIKRNSKFAIANPQFSQTESYMIGDLPNFDSIFETQTDMSKDELESIFHMISNSTLSLWSSRYKHASGLTSFYNMIDHPYQSLISSPELASLENVIFVAKTSAGIFVGMGDINVPFSLSSNLIYPDLLVWMRLLISMKKFSGKWSTSYPLTTITLEEAKQNVTSTLQPYDSVELKLSNANVILFYKSKSADTLMAYIRSKSPIQAIDDSRCYAYPRQCYADLNNYLSANTFNDVSNKICDLTSGPLKDDVDLLRKCKNALGNAKCKNGINRYSIDAFTQKNTQRIDFDIISFIMMIVLAIFLVILFKISNGPKLCIYDNSSNNWNLKPREIIFNI